MHFLVFGITGFFLVMVSEIEQLLKLYVQVTRVMHSSFFSLLRSSSMLLVEDSSSKLSVRMLAVSSSTLNVQSGWLTFSGLLTVMYPFLFSMSFPKKLMKIPSGFLSKSSSFFNCDKIACDILPSANLCVRLVTSLISCAVSSIPSESSYLYLILSTSQSAMCSAYSSSVSAGSSLITMLTKRMKACLITAFD